MLQERHIVKLISCSFVVDYPASQKVQALSRSFISKKGFIFKHSWAAGTACTLGGHCMCPSPLSVHKCFIMFIETQFQN